MIGQTAKVTNSDTGAVVSEVTFNASALPAQIRSYGRLLQSVDYATTGEPVLVRDGNSNATTLSSWKRGIAGTGQQVGKIEVGLPGSRERVKFDQNIGNYVDPQTGASSPTNNGMTSYGKDGIHIWPVRPTHEP